MWNIGMAYKAQRRQDRDWLVHIVQWYKMHIFPIPRESMTQALYCRTDRQLSLELMYIIHVHEIHNVHVVCAGYSVSELNRSNFSYQVCSIWPMIYLFSFQHAVVVQFLIVMIIWCDNIGLVSLILLSWELCTSYITVLCVQAITILSPLLFMPSLYSTF